MRHSASAVAIFVISFAAAAQEFPKGTREGAELLFKTVTLGADAGALRIAKHVKTGAPIFEVRDPARLRKALAGRKDLLTPALRDVLVGRWPAAEDDDLPLIFALLEILGDETRDRRALGFLGYFRGALDLGEGRPAHAIKNFAAGADHFAALGDADWQVECLIQVGLVHYRHEAAKEAAAVFEQALAIVEKKHGRQHVRAANCLHNLGEAYGQLGDTARAEKNLNTAAEILEKLGRHPRDLAAVYNSLGGHHHLAAALERAADFYRRGLKLRVETFGPDDPEVAKNLDNLADVLLDLGEARPALEHYQKAHKIFLKHFGPRHPDTAINLHLTANALAAIGDYEEALAAAKSALTDIERAFGHFHGQTAGVLSSLSHIHAKRGEYAKALELAQEALGIRLKLGGPQSHGVGVAYSRLAFAYARLEHYDEALTNYLKAAETLESVHGPKHPEAAANWNNVGSMHSKRGDPDQAIKHFERALAIYVARGDGKLPAAASVLANLALEHGLQGSTERALKLQQEAATIWVAAYGTRHPELALLNHNRAGLLYDGGDLSEALAAADAALAALWRGPAPKVKAPPHSPEDLEPGPLTLHVLALRGKIMEAALPRSATAEQWRACGRNYEIAAQLLERLRAEVLEQSESKLIHGAAALDWAPRWIGILQKLLELEHDPRDEQAAFDLVERVTARVFLESLGQARRHMIAGIPPEVQGEETRLHTALLSLDARLALETAKPLDRRDPDRIKWLGEELREAEGRWDDFRRRLDKAYPAYASLSRAQPPPLKEAAAALEAKEAALSFIPGREASFVVVLDRQETGAPRLRIRRLPPAEQIAEKIAALTDMETLANTRRVRALGREAYELILAPAADLIKGRELLIVPSGPLTTLPLELLVEDDRFLIENHAVRYTASLSALMLQREWGKRRMRPTEAVWALGDPVFNDDERLKKGKVGAAASAALARYGRVVLPRLVFSGKEVRDLTALWPKETVRLVLGEDASKRLLTKASAAGELARYRYVHLATHGLLGADQGVPPALVLSLTADDDGLLQMDEVTGLKLNADLVVLSACQTGKGRLARGEGVIGLSRAFLYAGSRGVVCSLWSVDDEATAKLMTTMYRNLKDGQSARNALRAARLDLLRGGEPPVYWAPFVLFGE